MKISLKGALVALVVLPIVLARASAAFATGTRDPVPVGPIYDPETKSYFELRTDLPHPPNWNMARRVARTKFFKGVRGHLAIVDNLHVHAFLRANFPVYEETWIGLRFICGVRKLVWVNGEIQKRSGFRAWAPRWHRTNITCRTVHIAYMPVYYTPTDMGFHWQAAGPKKYFISYFIEYNTGKP